MKVISVTEIKVIEEIIREEVMVVVTVLFLINMVVNKIIIWIKADKDLLILVQLMVIEVMALPTRQESFVKSMDKVTTCQKLLESKKNMQLVV